MLTTRSRKRGSAWLLATAAMAALPVLTACTPPTLPSKTATVQEVPFLGKQLTQPQIEEWRGTVDKQRGELQAALAKGKADCYQQFLVNRCLRENLRNYRMQEAVLRKQDIELNRQERQLRELDRQLRLQEKGRALP